MSNRKFYALILAMAVILIGFLAQISEVKSLRKDTDKLSSEISDLADQQERTWDKLDAMPTYTPPPVETAPVEESIIDPDIPLSDDLQEYIHHVCAEYGVDKSLVLAVIEVESDYTVDIVSPGGDYGLMQIAPVNHEWLAGMGMEVTTPEGNIEAGVYMLSLASQEYTDPAQILMAYNMGHTGAARALAQGITSTHYTDKVMTVLQSTEKEKDKMKSEWKVYSNVIGDDKQYIVGRQLDTSKPLHGGNVEYKSDYTTNRDAAQALADSLNEGDKDVL